MMAVSEQRTLFATHAPTRLVTRASHLFAPRLRVVGDTDRTMDLQRYTDHGASSSHVAIWAAVPMTNIPRAITNSATVTERSDDTDADALRTDPEKYVVRE